MLGVMVLPGKEGPTCGVDLCCSAGRVLLTLLGHSQGSVGLCEPLLLNSPVCVPCHSPTELPKMESKDLQQLFKDVLGSEREQHLGCGTPGLEGGRTPLQRPFLQGTHGRG